MAAAAPAAAAAGAGAAAPAPAAGAGAGAIASGSPGWPLDPRPNVFKALSDHALESECKTPESACTTMSFVNGTLYFRVAVAMIADANSVVHVGVRIDGRALAGHVGGASGVSVASNGKAYAFGSEIALPAGALPAWLPSTTVHVAFTVTLQHDVRTLDVSVNHAAPVRLTNALPPNTYRWAMSASHPGVQFHVQFGKNPPAKIFRDSGLARAACLAQLSGAPANRILVVGQTGAGKSAFVNTIATALQPAQLQLVEPMAESANTRNHNTTKTHTYVMQSNASGYVCEIKTALRLDDAPGSDNKADPMPIGWAAAQVHGHTRGEIDRLDIPHFGPGHKRYVANPSFEQRAAAAILVIDSRHIGGDGWAALPSAIVSALLAAQPALPIVVVITHCDDAQFQVADLARLYDNDAVQSKLEAVWSAIGHPAFPAVLYSENEQCRVPYKDLSALKALVFAVQKARHFVPKLQQQLAADAEDAARDAADADAKATAAQRKREADLKANAARVVKQLGGDVDPTRVAIILAQHDNDIAKAFAADAFADIRSAPKGAAAAGAGAGRAGNKIPSGGKNNVANATGDSDEETGEGASK